MRDRRSARLLLVALCGLLALNYPWLSLFSAPTLVAGLPPLLLWLFGVWLAVILAVWRIQRRPDGDEEDGDG